MTSTARWALAFLVVLAVLQLIRPTIPARPATSEVQAPNGVRQILNRSCYSCHSDERRLSWFDQIVPAYWLVRHDVLTARSRLDFSTLGSRPAAAQEAALYEAVNMIRLGAMPLPRFVQLHPEARVTPDELASLEAYLAPWSTRPQGPAPGAGSAGNSGAPSPIGSAGVAAPVDLTKVHPELDGLSFDPAFEGWEPISTTDRGDNNTFRFILANGIAMKAAQAGNIAPWPDGSRFAKVAWQQAVGTDGLVHPGAFVQVELMVKDARLYSRTEGWGWGRWRGPDLKPYGSDPRFVDECTGCHLPVRGNDYVYTLPITTAHVRGEEVVNNAAAALPADLPWQPLDWGAITLYVDPQNHATATLYGNDIAMRAVQARNPQPQAPAYPAGAVLALVTWAQRDDPHWFGARIPGQFRSVEFVEVAATGHADTYRRFAGSGLAEDRAAEAASGPRINSILSLPPARLP